MKYELNPSVELILVDILVKSVKDFNLGGPFHVNKNASSYIVITDIFI
jgi:hypothetical protein